MRGHCPCADLTVSWQWEESKGKKINNRRVLAVNADAVFLPSGSASSSILEYDKEYLPPC